ncbi:MAG: hypothetical protein JWN39_1623, partial [Ilumatobacteraceae bacterium]|nr:hypothetical protein [Ilumatobacteraceae bacterium]
MKRVAVSLLVAVGLLSAVVEVAPARVAAASDVDLAVDTVTATPPSVLAGETVQVSAVVHNVGPNDATAVSAVVFTLPDGVTLAPGSGCTDAAPEVQCVTTNSLLAGADETVSINVVVDAAPSGAIVVALTGVDDDPDLSNNSGSASIALAPATTGSITGHVVVAGATALSGSITLLTSNTGNYVGSAPIDVTGEYHFDNIAFGTYRLQVNAGGLQSRWYPSSPDQGGSSTVTIDAGTPAANNVDVTYPTGSISGTVSFRSSGLGSVNVSIQPVNAIMFGYASMTTDSNGAFVFRGLEPGSYRVQTSSATGSATYGGDTAPLPVVVGAADVTGIDLVVPPGVISGTVVDSVGSPVTSGAVTATLQSYPNISRGVSVVDGTFFVSGLAAGTYRLTYSSNSGAPYTHPIDVTVSDALPDVTGVALALPSPASLQGTVYSAPGVPATNTWVYIYPTSGMAMGIGAVTDENGSYQFTNVSPGSYRIQTTIGTTTYYYPSSPDSSTAQTVAVGSGQTLTGLDISKPSGAISGHIFNGAVGIEGLTVSVTSPTGYPVYATAVTDANGAYTANGLPPGTYRVGVAGPGFSSRYYPSATSTYLGSDVVLTASGPLTGIDITYPTGAVSGTVMYRGAPVSGTTVTVQSFMTMGYYAATTNASGQFTVHGVDPGSYQIRASGAQGSAVWGGEMFPTNVTVASAEVTGIALVIPPGIISGQVIDSMGLPVSQGNVTAQQVGGSFNRSAALVPGGGFTLSGLEVGTYRLQYSLYGANNYTHPTDLTVSAMSPDVTGVQISLALPGTVTGTVYQSAGVPQPNTYVSLATSTSVAMGLSTTTDAGGHYTFTNVAPGSYRVSATIGMTTYYYPNASSQVNATLFTVAGGQTVSGIDISRPAGSISGRITGGTDPVTGSVTIFTQTGMYVMNVGIGANGAYTAGGLDVGTYKVQVNGNGYPSRYYPSTTDLFSATAVAVTAASPAVTGIDISYPSGSVSGTVTRRGAAVSMTAVYAESTSGSMLQFGQVTTDMAGQFTIRGLAPGTYRVRASGMMGAAYFGGGAGTIVTVGTVNVAGIDIVLPPGS